MDFFLFGPLETILLLWFGDLEAAKEGWKKTIDAWQQIEVLVQKGERQWSEYVHEV